MYPFHHLRRRRSVSLLTKCASYRNASPDASDRFKQTRARGLTNLEVNAYSLLHGERTALAWYTSLPVCTASLIHDIEFIRGMYGPDDYLLAANSFCPAFDLVKKPCTARSRRATEPAGATFRPPNLRTLRLSDPLIYPHETATPSSKPLRSLRPPTSAPPCFRHSDSRC